jgi:hypothetical protein
MRAPAITEHSASSAASKWLRAMGMEPGDVLVEECQEVDSCLVRTATRIERDGVIIRRIEEVPPLLAIPLSGSRGSPAA